MKSNDRKDAVRDICRGVGSTTSKGQYLYMTYRVTTSVGSFSNDLCSKAFTTAYGISKFRLKTARQVYYN
jgi:hypothetical protein